MSCGGICCFLTKTALVLRSPQILSLYSLSNNLLAFKRRKDGQAKKRRKKGNLADAGKNNGVASRCDDCPWCPPQQRS
jgi:hypothetical protein